jgi:hypothetical protein
LFILFWRFNDEAFNKKGDNDEVEEDEQKGITERHTEGYK